MDPFEDVRSLASVLLVMQSCIPELGGGSRYTKFIDRAEVMTLKSGRGDHADGVSRANAIVYETVEISGNVIVSMGVSKMGIIESLISSIEARVHLAQDNMTVAVQQFPLHGALASLRYVYPDTFC
jgi:hypothetical protein